MPSAPLTWDLPLGRAPRIRMASAVAQHGERPVEAYRLDGFWCLNLYHGEVTWRIGGSCFRLRRGWATITPPDRDHEYAFAAPVGKSWVHFIPDAGGRRVAMPAVADLAAGFAAAVEDVAFVARHHRTEPDRAAARLWDLLWRVQSCGFAMGEAADSGVLSRVERIVRRRLSEQVRVDDVAAELGRSVWQLNRLLRREVDRSLSEVISGLRLEQAAHLLQHSDLPIGEIGRRVGYPDAHRFNKVVRRCFKLSPRELRRSARGMG